MHPSILPFLNLSSIAPPTGAILRAFSKEGVPGGGNLHGAEKVSGDVTEVIITAQDITVAGQGAQAIESKPTDRGLERRFGAYSILDTGTSLVATGRNANLEFGRPLDLELQFVTATAGQGAGGIAGLAQRMQVWTDPPFVKSFAASHILREVAMVLEPPAPNPDSIVRPPRLVFMVPGSPSQPATFYRSQNVEATTAGLSVRYPASVGLSMVYDAAGGSFLLTYKDLVISRIGGPGTAARIEVGGKVLVETDVAAMQVVRCEGTEGPGGPKWDESDAGIRSWTESDVSIEYRTARGKDSAFLRVQSGAVSVAFHPEGDHRGRIFKLVYEDVLELTALAFRDMTETWTQLTVEEPQQGIKAHVQLRPRSVTDRLLRSVLKT